MPSVSVSNLELYRVWRDSEELDLEWLLRRLRGEEPQTEQMMAGEALHAAIENAGPQDAMSLVHGEWKFYFNVKSTVELPTSKELSVEKQYGDLTVRGRVDALRGKTVTDYKSTGSFDADRLLEGYQWRFYLDMMDCDTFRWIVFVMSDRLYREYEIYQVHELMQHRYPQLHEDCWKLAADFLDFAKQLEANGQEWRRAAVLQK